MCNGWPFVKEAGCVGPFGKEACIAGFRPDSRVCGGGMRWWCMGHHKDHHSCNLPKQKASDFSVESYFALDRCLLISTNN